MTVRCSWARCADSLDVNYDDGWLYGPYRVTDKDNTTISHTDNTVAGAWIAVDLGRPHFTPTTFNVVNRRAVSALAFALPLSLLPFRLFPSRGIHPACVTTNYRVTTAALVCPAQRTAVRIGCFPSFGALCWPARSTRATLRGRLGMQYRSSAHPSSAPMSRHSAPTPLRSRRHAALVRADMGWWRLRWNKTRSSVTELRAWSEWRSCKVSAATRLSSLRPRQTGFIWPA